MRLAPMLTSTALQDVNREQVAEADTYEDSLAPPLHKASEEPTWAELMNEVAVSSTQSSLPPGSDSQQDLEHRPRERAWKAKGHPAPAKPHRTKPEMLPWWSEDQPLDEKPNACMPPESPEPDEQAEGAADSQGGSSRRDAAWEHYSAEVSEHSAVDYPRHNPMRPSSDLSELQHLRQHAQELARSEEALRQEVTSLTQQLDQADNQAAAYAQLQERCAELQWHITELEESAQAQEVQYSALEREHAQVQDSLDGQLEVIAEKATQQQQDLATALESLRAGQAAQQALMEDNARLEKQVSSGNVQLISVQGKLQTAQIAADRAEARGLDLSGKVEALQEELARQREINAGELVARAVDCQPPNLAIFSFQAEFSYFRMLMLFMTSCAESKANKDLKAELDYVREECEAAQAKGKELQIKKNAAEARLVTLHSPVCAHLHFEAAGT